MNLPSDMAYSPKLGFGSHPPPPLKQDTQLLYQHKPADETPTTEEEITAAKLRSTKFGAPPTTQMAKVFRPGPTTAPSTGNLSAHPSPAPTAPPTHYVYIPPVIILQLMGQVVARGSPYGMHQSEERYKKHLKYEKGYGDERIAAHLEVSMPVVLTNRFQLISHF